MVHEDGAIVVERDGTSDDHPGHAISALLGVAPVGWYMIGNVTAVWMIVDEIMMSSLVGPETLIPEPPLTPAIESNGDVPVITIDDPVDAGPVLRDTGV